MEQLEKLLLALHTLLKILIKNYTMNDEVSNKKHLSFVEKSRFYK